MESTSYKINFKIASKSKDCVCVILNLCIFPN